MSSGCTFNAKSQRVIVYGKNNKSSDLFDSLYYNLITNIDDKNKYGLASNLKNDKKIVLAAVKQDGMALQFAAISLKKNKHIENIIRNLINFKNVN